MDKYEYLWTIVRNNMLPGDISCDNYLYQEICKMSVSQMNAKLGISKKSAEYIVSAIEKTDIEEEYDKFICSDIKSVTLRDKEYPERLRYIENKPYALFYLGELPSETRKSVAIIGARNCTEYGRTMAENIANGLAKERVNIISGMAYGIDGIAQMSALNEGGKTYGILGCGVDVCYPRVNRNLYGRLISDGGVISEYPPGSAAKPDNFPMRNRIISALSDIVIVVEARMKSGTFITVDCALSQGKEIMVVPGRATDSLSVGCNALLFQGAHPVQSSDDVIRLLETVVSDDFYQKNNVSEFRTKELKKYIPKESEKILLEREENMVYSVLDFYALSPEDVAKSINMDIIKVMGILVSLEMKGVIKETGKNLYVKCR